MTPTLTAEDLDALRTHLAKKLGCDVAFEAEPAFFSRGLASDVYGFSLLGDGLPLEWTGPLVLRVTKAEVLQSDLEREQAVQRFLSSQAYPAPAILLIEPSGAVIGLPFAVMRRAPGHPVQRLAFGNPVRASKLATLFADAHVDLHSLSVDGFPSRSPGTTVERVLDRQRSWLGNDPQTLEDFAWLEARRDAVLPEQLAVCHNNYQPANVVVDDDERYAVVDWDSADLGDRHADVADAMVALRTARLPQHGTLARLRVPVGRMVFVRRYLTRYRQQLPLDGRRLCFWQALRAFAWKRNILAVVAGEPARLPGSADGYERQLAWLDRHFRARQREFDGA